MSFEVLVFAVFGAIVGSFLNVVILRRGVHTLGGRSGCFSCRAQLRAFDLVPVVSWVAFGGRCRSCGSAVSAQYPLVEGSTALLFGLIGGVPDMSLFLRVFCCAISAYLILIAAYDMRHTIIPDEWAYGFAFLAFISIPLLPRTTSLAEALISGPLTALPFAVLWALSRGRWMGLGDAKLALGIGWLLGPIYGLYAIFLSFIVGAIVGVTILLPMPHYRRVLRKAGIARLQGFGSYTMKSEVPFGPFLVCTCFLVWIFLLYGHPIALPL